MNLPAIVQAAEVGTATQRLTALGALDCAAAEGVTGAAALARWIVEHPQGPLTPEDVVTLDVLHADLPRAS